MPRMLPKSAPREKIIRINLVNSKNRRTFAPAFVGVVSTDPLAQSVEHNTFNVGVLGSNPKRITKNNPQETKYQLLADFCIYKVHHFCTT